MSFLFWALKAKDAVETAIFWKKFKTWQAARDARLAAEKAAHDEVALMQAQRDSERKAGTLLVILVAAVLSTAATCGKQIVKDAADLQVYCCVEHPEECRNLPIAITCPATPRPTATPTATEIPAQTAVPTPTMPAAASPTPTATPTATPAPAEPTPTPACIPRPGAQPVSIAWPKRCPAYTEPLAFEGEGNVIVPPAYGALCAVKAGEGNTRTSWRLGYGGGRQGLAFVWHGGAFIQDEPGRGCVDAFGRYFPDCEHVYEHPEGETAPYTHGGYVMPSFCSDAPPTPAPTRPPGPTPAAGDCAAVAAIEHGLAGAGHCHAWHLLPDGRVYCILDSTVRPICDTDHMDNYTTFCGNRTHDPDYDSPSGAQDWTISGAEDRGPHPSNSAQRVIVGSQGATVRVTVCLRSDARTVDGCPIPRKGDSCARPPEWDLPREGDQ